MLNLLDCNLKIKSYGIEFVTKIQELTSINGSVSSILVLMGIGIGIVALLLLILIIVLKNRKKIKVINDKKKM